MSLLAVGRHEAYSAWRYAVVIRETQEVPYEYEKKLLCCKEDRALAQAAQRVVECPLQRFRTHLDTFLCDLL